MSSMQFFYKESLLIIINVFSRYFKCERLLNTAKEKSKTCESTPMLSVQYITDAMKERRLKK